MSLYCQQSTPITQSTRYQYIKYLEDQLEKFSTFMLYQQKQNQKHHHLIHLIHDQNQKIRLLNDKVLLVELYQNQNLKNHQKLLKSLEKSISLQKRVNKLQQNCFSDNAYNKNMQNIIYPGEKKQLIKDIECKIHEVKSQILEQMAYFKKNIINKINISSNDQEVSNKVYYMRQKGRRSQSKDTMSPIQTNYTENDKSRLKQIDKNIPLYHKQNKQNYKKISCFVNEKLSHLEDQSTQRYRNPNSSLHCSIKEKQISQTRQRSPISAYLKKQNQYNSSQQNTYMKNKHATPLPFYSACEERQVKIKKNQTRRSKSKSKSKSNRSVSKSNNSKSKNQFENETSDFKLKKNSCKSMKAPKRKEVKTERIDKFQEVIHRKIKEKTLSNKIKSKKNTSRQRVKSNNSSRLSQLQISQVSNQSRSRSRSNQKLCKNQKQYLMCCNKFH